MSSDFYIGWMDKAPNGITRYLRKYVMALIIIGLLLAATFAILQKEFRTGNFEFGTLTLVKGFYSKLPVPNIRVVTGKDIWGKEDIVTIPLIGYGKFGAEGAIANFEKKNNISLEGRDIEVKGTLLYDDGKVLMQIDENDNPFQHVASASQSKQPTDSAKSLGIMTLKGEIVDPKCFFGVMKPGEGKVHKDCAIRCILGGMPPVLKVTNEQGRQNYYLLLGRDGGKINEAIRDFIAEPVELTARAVEFNDWIVLYLDKPNAIKRYSYLQDHFSGRIALCENNCK